MDRVFCNINRRAFILTWCSAATLADMRGDDGSKEPWSKAEQIEPAELAKRLSNPEKQLHVFCGAFPVLYRQRHILHAEFAGSGGKPEGIDALRAAVAKLPKNSEIVIYCGCCPMASCPNIRPAFRALKELGLKNVHVLDLPTNFHTDWAAKGYPVEP